MTAPAQNGGYRVPYSRLAVTVRSGQAGGKPAGFGGFAEVTRQIAGCFPGLSRSRHRADRAIP